MEHEIKVTPLIYKRVKSGEMTFQLLDNSPGYQKGDTIVLREFDGEPLNSTDKAAKGFTDSPPLTFKIGFILILSKHEVVFSLMPIKKSR